MPLGSPTSALSPQSNALVLSLNRKGIILYQTAVNWQEGESVAALRHAGAAV